jgi:hypothetical protein
MEKKFEYNRKIRKGKGSLILISYDVLMKKKELSFDSIQDLCFLYLLIVLKRKYEL